MEAGGGPQPAQGIGYDWTAISYQEKLVAIRLTSFTPCPSSSYPGAGRQYESWFDPAA